MHGVRSTIYVRSKKNMSVIVTEFAEPPLMMN